MALALYNTLSKKIETIEPIRPGTVSMYHCGPTVYDYAHIGNLRSFFLADLLRRVFEQNGLSVKQIMNITDVDDKTIKQSREENMSLKELTAKYEKSFLEDLRALNIQTPHGLPKATENIPEMIELIKKLMDGGFAYKGEDGIYFSIEKDPDYGKLAELSSRKTSLARIKNDEYDKDDPQDFALWKFHTKDDGDVYWDAPFGSGRPGWHIECSAMSMKALGESFDIHSGGIDLIFPHHVNEIAQSEGATGKTFVKTWVHNNFILVEDKKMSKSLGNIITLRDIENRRISPLSYRYWLLTSHYRTLANFTWEGISGAERAYDKLGGVVASYPQNGKIDLAYKAEFESFVNDDLDTPKAIALTWDLIKDQEVSSPDKRATILYFDQVFGLKLADLKPEEIPENIRNLAEEREKSRLKKDFENSDKLREELEGLGYEIKDSENGPSIKKKR